MEKKYTEKINQIKNISKFSTNYNLKKCENFCTPIKEKGNWEENIKKSIDKEVEIIIKTIFVK